MPNSSGNFFKVKSALRPASQGNARGHAPKLAAPQQTYPKTFRWPLPPGQTEVPEKVEVAGTFAGWQKYEMVRDISGVWQLTFENIPGHRTHHYMFFADGKPVEDKQCDGLAEPQDPQEAEYALATPRGPRVFMLFAQTK
jgi:hypothetical protein